MHQICDGYNPNVRMGNWLEESYSVSQPFRNNPHKISRDPEIDIGYIDAHFKLRPLNRVSRMPHWNTAGLVEAPQYQKMIKKTTTKQNYDVGVTNHFFKDWKPRVFQKNGGENITGSSSIKIDKCKRDYRMFNNSNVQELLNERSSDTSSFKSSLVPAKHIEPSVLLKTIYQRDISEKEGEKVGSSFTKKDFSTSTLQKPSFRRIRSEITMKNLPNLTYK